jgi:hypothetical protein
MNIVNAYSDMTPLQFLAPTTLSKHAGAAVGVILDTRPYKGTAALVFNHTGIDDTTAAKAPTIDLKVQSASTTNGQFADVTGAAFTQLAADTADTSGTPAIESIALPLAACKRYIRLWKVAPTSAADTIVCVGSVSALMPKSAT